MKTRLLFGAALLLLAGCQEQKPAISVTTEPEAQPRIPLTRATLSPKRVDPRNPPVWGRQDCTALNDTKETQDRFVADKSACESKVGVAPGTQPLKIYYCMADKGYNYRPANDSAKECAAQRS